MVKGVCIEWLFYPDTLICPGGHLAPDHRGLHRSYHWPHPGSHVDLLPAHDVLGFLKAGNDGVAVGSAGGAAAFGPGAGVAAARVGKGKILRAGGSTTIAYSLRSPASRWLPRAPGSPITPSSLPMSPKGKPPGSCRRCAEIRHCSGRILTKLSNEPLPLQLQDVPAALLL